MSHFVIDEELDRTFVAALKKRDKEYLTSIPLKVLQSGTSELKSWISLAGALMGFVLPLASAIAHSVSPLDMAAWSAIALLVQVVVYAVAARLIPHFAQAIEAGRAAPAVLLATLSLSVGVLNAACLTY